MHPFLATYENNLRRRVVGSKLSVSKNFSLLNLRKNLPLYTQKINSIRRIDRVTICLTRDKCKPSSKIKNTLARWQPLKKYYHSNMCYKRQACCNLISKKTIFCCRKQPIFLCHKYLWLAQVSYKSEPYSSPHHTTSDTMLKISSHK